MPLREKFKQSIKGFKGDIRALLKRSDKAATTRPATPSSTQPHTAGPALAGRISPPSVSECETPPPASMLAIPPINGDSDSNIHLERPADTTNQIEGDYPGVTEQSKNAPDTGSQLTSTALMASAPQASEPNVPYTGQDSAAEQSYRKSVDEVSAEKGLEVFAKGLVESAMSTLKFGPLKDVSDMLQGFADMYIMDGAVKKEYDALQQRLHKLLSVLGKHSDQDVSQATQSKVQAIRDFIQGELNSLEINLNQGKPSARRLTMARDEQDRFLACCQRIQDYMDQLLLDTSVLVWKMEGKQLKDHMSSLVSSLPFSSSACYNSRAGEELKRRECTPGTRVDVLGTLLGWARNNSKNGVYWLNGMAGTGKTTIACSVCKALDGEGNLAASFFCSRLREECREVNMIIPSIAYQIARRSQSFHSKLSTILEKEPDIHTKRLDMQFKALIEEPLLSAGTYLAGRLVVVIDALDECENKGSTSQVLQVLLSKAADVPLKFIVSSRPEPHVRDQLAGERVDSRIILHELDTSKVQADIKTYLQDELKPMDPPPSEAQIAALVERAGVLFIYAATAVRYIGLNNFKRNPSGRLRTILHGSQGKRTSANKDIDELYSTILEAAFSEQGLDEDDEIDMQLIINTVICAREPLTVSALSELLQIHDVGRVRGALDPMQSVLHVVEPGGLVTTLHASFPDFMFDPARSKTWTCDFQACNRKLAEHCLERIRATQPQLNICRLESSYEFDEEVPDIDNRVATTIPFELLYACQYWADHVQAGKCASSVVVGIQDFLSRRLFLWLEVLNLKKRLRAGVECMKMTSKWGNEFDGDRDMVELVRDARRFVDAFVSSPISRSTPHIYISMMAFWPRSSPIAKCYAKFMQGPVAAEGTALGRRDPAHLSTWVFGGIYRMATSADGLWIALGTDKEVILVDSSNGRRVLEPLRGHPNSVESIAFSHDGARIYAGSIDGRNATILGWGTRSGHRVLGPFQLSGHTDEIKCLSFSLDCTRIATGSKDKTARLWDAETGTMLSRFSTDDAVWSIVFSLDGTSVAFGFCKTLHIRGTHTGDTSMGLVKHTVDFDMLAFAPDKSSIISAPLFDNTLYVWNAQNGQKIFGPIKAHTADVNCIGCSPDGRYIVSGSKDRTVCVWNAQTGNIALGPLKAHTGYVTSVAFTPDGSRIISTCNRGLVCTWDAQQRSLPPSSTSAPFHPITCVKFSSDGTRFVSGSKEGTISIWDAQTGKMRVGPIEAHASQINAVDSLNDRVVSGADDGTICVCDILTGEVVLGPLQLATGKILAIRYSPDGQMIATGSYSRVDVWNGETGNRVLGPLTGVGVSVASVQFSPDGTRIVASAATYGLDVAVWDISTSENVFETLDTRRDYVHSVSYSPNGRLIATSSYDTTIIVWDAYTRTKQLRPLTAHSGRVRSVHFSPDSTHLVSGSGDGRILIWDVETGEVVFELFNRRKCSIISVEYSPDGARILSRSGDNSVRIHDARSPAERARSESEVGDWTIKKDGWVVDEQSRLLVWVPADLRKALLLPSTVHVRAPEEFVRLKIDKSHIGGMWEQSYLSGM